MKLTEMIGLLKIKMQHQKLAWSQDWWRWRKCDDDDDVKRWVPWQ